MTPNHCANCAFEIENPERVASVPVFGSGTVPSQGKLCTDCGDYKAEDNIHRIFHRDGRVYEAMPNVNRTTSLIETIPEEAIF